MKKRLLFATLLLTFVCQLAFGQSATSVFNDFREKKSAEFITIPRLMIGLAATKLSDGNTKELLKDVKEVKILNMDDCSKSVRSKFAKKISELTSKGYDSFTGVKSGKSKDFSVMMRQDGDVVTEIVTLVHDDDTCVGVLVTGNIKVENIAAVIGLVDEY